MSPSPSVLPRAVPAGGEPFLRRGEALAVFAAWTAFALARTLVWSQVSPVGLTSALGPLHNLGRAWLWAAMTPAIWWLAARVPLGARGIVAHAAAATAAALLDSAVFRGLLVVLRPEITLHAFASRFLVDHTGNTFLYLAAAAIGTARLHRGLLDERGRAAEGLRARTAEARLNALAAQMQPHFLCNALNAVAELWHRDVGRGRDVLGRLRALLVGPLAAPTAALVPFDEELGLLEAYAEIQRARFGDRLRIVAHAPAAARRLLVPGFALQTLVENSVRHGGGRRRVEVRAEVDGARLRLVVRDDGRGPAAGWREGVGLGNLRRRLAALDGTLELRAAPSGGAEVAIAMPARERCAIVDELPRVSPLPPASSVPAWAAIGLFWAAMAALWAAVRVAMNPYLPLQVDLLDGLDGSLRSAAPFALLSAALLASARLRRGRAALQLGAAVAALVLLPVARAMASGTPARFDDHFVVNLFLDASVFLVAAGAARAALDLSRARERDREVARLEHELAEARLSERRLRLDPLALSVEIDAIGRAAGENAERADELTVALADRLRAAAHEEELPCPSAA